MYKISRFLVAGAFLGALAMPAVAAEHSTSSSHKRTGTYSFERHEQGEHSMSGTVSDIDHSKGTLTLNTKEGMLKLHYPEAAIKDVNNGDTITAQLAFAPIPKGMSQSAADQPEKMHGKMEHEKEAMGEHWMTGTVTSVDTATGNVSVNTAEAPLDLHFPPKSISHLKKGERIAVELAFSKK